MEDSVFVSLSPFEFTLPPYPIETCLPLDPPPQMILAQVHYNPLIAKSSSHQMVFGIAGFFLVSAAFEHLLSSNCLPNLLMHFHILLGFHSWYFFNE